MKEEIEFIREEIEKRTVYFKLRGKEVTVRRAASKELPSETCHVGKASVTASFASKREEETTERNLQLFKEVGLASYVLNWFFGPPLQVIPDVMKSSVEIAVEYKGHEFYLYDFPADGAIQIYASCDVKPAKQIVEELVEILKYITSIGPAYLVVKRISP